MAYRTNAFIRGLGGKNSVGLIYSTGVSFPKLPRKLKRRRYAVIGNRQAAIYTMPWVYTRKRIQCLCDQAKSARMRSDAEERPESDIRVEAYLEHFSGPIPPPSAMMGLRRCIAGQRQPHLINSGT